MKTGEVKLRKAENGFIITAQISNANGLFSWQEFVVHTLEDALKQIEKLYEGQ